MPAPPLPRSRPADQGVASTAVGALLDALDAAPDIELHSLMLLRHGHVVAEGWRRPYRPERAHLLYSLSKSFTATAAGLAAAEGLLTLDDLVVDHFPELAGEVRHPWTRSMQVRHLAAMATGHREDTLDRARRLDPAEPVRGFLALDPDEPPGSVFAYNNGATYTLGAIVQRVTGETLTRYLQPRLFDPLGIAPPWWHSHPADRELGYSGLHLPTEAVARFGQLYLDDGVWQGRRLLPEGWVAEASRLHTPNPDEPNPDWQQGYGYQLWRGRHGYRGDGAYGQFCLVLPEQDTVLVTTAQTGNMQGILDAVWAHLLPGLGAATPESDDALSRRLGDLVLPPDGPGPVGADATADLAWRVTRLEEAEDGWLATVTDGVEEIAVPCGAASWRDSRHTLGGGRVLELAASTSSGADGLTLQLIFVQTPHRLVLHVDAAASRTSALWRTGPLHAPTLAGLALGPTSPAAEGLFQPAGQAEGLA